MTRALAAAALVGVTMGLSPCSAKAQAPAPWRAYCSDDARTLAERELARSVAPEEIVPARRAADAALARLDALRSAFRSGADVEAAYLPAARFQKLALGTADAELAELYRRAAADQFARAHLTALAQGVGWAAGLSGAARRFAYSIAGRDGCGVDAANTAWLEARLDAKGWFRISLYGDDADRAAFLIAQHADANRPFQRKVLALLEPLLRSKDTQPGEYALLFDRVAVGDARPQRYGSQGRCTAPGVWTELPVEDPSNIDSRRADIGLEPMAAYRARFVQLCR